MGSKSDARAAERPNIILLLADDLGYGDLSCFGSLAVKTPHLDRLAGEGMKFNRFYAGSAVCSPTRASVLTGRYPLRFGITKHFNDVNRWLPESATTVAELLKNAGYNTAHVGKWHLGGLARAKDAGTEQNIYFHATDPEVGARMLKKQQQDGVDIQSLAVDPMFANPADGDFRLKSDSPALKLGFMPIDLSKIGLTREN
jgi:arylsulfatase A-like enzyme